MNIPSTYPLIAQEATAKPRPYRLGIALSGGGARGFAHVGALKAIEEAGLKPDIIAGVSAGSIAGALYSAGVPVDEMLGLFAGIKFTDFCSLAITDREGIFSLRKLGRFMEKNTGVKRIEELGIPLRIGATNFDEGKPVAFSSGALGERITASCSIPVVFAPVKIDGTYYVDGGVLRNLPAWTIRDDCETLIGINCSPMPNRHLQYYRRSIVSIAMRSYQLLAKSNQNVDMALCDLVVKTTAIAGYGAFNLHDIKQVYLNGYSATRQAIKDWQKQENP